MATLLVALMAIAPGAEAAWFNNAWPLRRPIDVTWDAEHGGEGELAYVEFYTAGRHKLGASDVRVATDAGKVMPSRILRVGPGDKVRVVFALEKLVRRYYVYFGKENSPDHPDEKAPEPVMQFGMLMEMKGIPANAKGDNFQQIEALWGRGAPPIGATLVERPFLGFNPLGDQDRTIARLTGQLFAPLDGDYLFAISADDRAALFIDGTPVCFAANAVSDMRFNGKIHLARGRHALLIYHLNLTGPSVLSVGWQAPGMPKPDVIGRESFGIVPRGVTGALEDPGGTMIADFKPEYLAECVVADHSTYRFRYTANLPKTQSPVKIEWDFGDGQKAEGEKVEHVYLANGEFSLSLTFRIGNNRDTRITRFDAHRDWERQTGAAQDEPPVHSKIVSTYNAGAIPVGSLPQAVLLDQRGGNLDAMFATTGRLLAEPSADADRTLVALGSAREAAIEANRLKELYAAFDRLSDRSPVRAQLLAMYAELLLWHSADFDRAVAVLKPVADSPVDGSKRLYAQALLLDQKAEESRKVFQSLPPGGPPAQQAALSGALARSIEFYLHEGDALSGLEAWNTWQTRFPTDFLEGYGVLLRVRLMELEKLYTPASKVAEAFASAVPDSPYSPQLLDRASTLLSQSDPRKSAALRQLLKTKYPEDPLSQ